MRPLDVPPPARPTMWRSRQPPVSADVHISRRVLALPVVGGVVIGGLIAAVVVLSLRIAATSGGGGSPAAGSGMMGSGMRMNEALGMSDRVRAP